MHFTAVQPSSPEYARAIRLVNLGLALYSVDVVIAVIDGEDAVGWAEEQHRQGQEHYTQGYGQGGRFVPTEAIRRGRHGRGGAGQK